MKIDNDLLRIGVLHIPSSQFYVSLTRNLNVFGLQFLLLRVAVPKAILNIMPASHLYLYMQHTRVNHELVVVLPQEQDKEGYCGD
jgi:hypothetical protein